MLRWAGRADLEHDGVFDAELVGGQRVGLPAQALVGVAEVLRARDVGAELDVGGRQVARPRREQVLAVLWMTNTRSLLKRENFTVMLYSHLLSMIVYYKSFYVKMVK